MREKLLGTTPLVLKIMGMLEFNCKSSIFQQLSFSSSCVEVPDWFLGNIYFKCQETTGKSRGKNFISLHKFLTELWKWNIKVEFVFEKSSLSSKCWGEFFLIAKVWSPGWEFIVDIFTFLEVKICPLYTCFKIGSHINKCGFFCWWPLEINGTF